MPGKTALVTGATAGIGFYTAAALARRGARVFVTGRDEIRGHQAVAELRRLAGHNAVEFLVADASSVADNVELAEELSRRVDRLDVLINNAGGVFAERGETDEGLERTLALNFVGPVLLTQHLLRLLGRSRTARIINVVSSAFQMWKGNPLDDPQSRRRYVGIDAYARAKLLNLLFTLALARDLAEVGIHVNAVNPGMAWTPGTESLTPEAVPQWRFIWPLVRWFQRRASAALAGEAVASLATPASFVLSGRYVESKREKNLPQRLLDPALQQRAWDLGESLAARALAESPRMSRSG